MNKKPIKKLLNYIDNAWRPSATAEFLDVMNPATGMPIAQVPLSTADETAEAIVKAREAQIEWARVPVTDRIQFLFKMKRVIEDNLDELCRICTDECGKIYAESKGELQRAIENIEVACGAPILMQGYNTEDIARGIDEHMFRQPIGVVAAITPFNFPGMIPFWFLPYAIACGNSFILKPSEKTPMTAQRIFELIDTLGLPPGVLQIVNGGKETVDTLLDHPAVAAISFVGSSATARYIYSRAAANGKRAQCQGGAKNPVVIMPDADMDMATKIVADAAFGCAGQRCLALSQVINVEDAHAGFAPRITEVAQTRKVGYGLDDGVEMGPVIREESRTRINGLIAQAQSEGAKITVNGAGRSVSGYESGYFAFPTIINDLPPAGTVARTEIFGPVLSMTSVKTLEEAIALVNDRAYGNMACIFTGSGSAARRFRQEVSAGNVGINIGVAAPMAFFPFSGWNESFFGDLHGQARHGIEFYTQTKVVVERWPKEWNRKF
jgi:malonate-semialdehyde dehydrogenase (acetylating)/methylmalonate-semialdehyde dehydrogenase